MTFSVLWLQMLTRAAVLNLFRLADHLTNFVSVRGPPKQFLHFLGESSEFMTTFLAIPPNFFSVRETQTRISPIFPISLHFSGSRTGRNIPISICNLHVVVTQSMKRYQVLVHNFVRNQPEGWVNFCSKFNCFYFSIVM